MPSSDDPIGLSGPAFLQADELTSASLRPYFAAANLDVVVDDDSLCLHGGPIAVYVLGDPKRERVRLLALFAAAADTSHDQLLALANEVNRRLVLVRASVLDDSLVIEHNIFTWGGMTGESLVRTVEHFASVLEHLGACDVDDVLL